MTTILGISAFYHDSAAALVIDGRIGRVLSALCVGGPVVVPTCVLDELHLLADSRDRLKRERGRYPTILANDGGAWDPDLLVAGGGYRISTVVVAIPTDYTRSKGVQRGLCAYPETIYEIY